MKLRLTVDVEYEENGEDPEILKRLLQRLPSRAADHGLMTDCGPAEVLGWSVNVEEIQ